MSDETTPPATTTTTDEAADLTAETPPEAPERPEREAAKYRRQLRNVETERDALRERLATAQRAMVEKIASEAVEIRPHEWVKLTHGGDAFTIGGLDPAAVHDETGALDAEAVAESLRNLYESRADLFTRATNPRAAVGPYVPTQGDSPGQPFSEHSWASALRGADQDTQRAPW